MTATYTVPFPLLSDPDLSAHEAFKVVNALDEAGVQHLAKLGIDLERWSKRKHHKIAIPSLFLIDKERTVRWAHAARDYKTRPKESDVLEAIAKVIEPK